MRLLANFNHLLENIYIMATIVLVSYGSAKKKEPSPARELYTGNLFRASFAYAQALDADKIFILSALHGS